MPMGKKGFTLVELVVISPIIIFSIGYTMAFLIDLYLDTNRQVTRLNLKSDAQNLLYRLQDDLFFATSFTNILPDDHEDTIQRGVANLGENNWSHEMELPIHLEVNDDEDKYKTTEKYAVLISSQPAITTPPDSGDRQPIWKIPTPTDNCDFEEFYSFPLLVDTAVYYVHKISSTEGRLYRRVVTQDAPNGTCPSADPDLESYQTTTFPPGGGSPQDSLISDKIHSIDVNIYDGSDTEINGIDFSYATKAKVKVTLKDMVNGEVVYESSEITLRKVNLDGQS